MSKIVSVKAKVYKWTGPVQKIHENFCTNAADIVNQENISNDRWTTYKFHSWLVVEVETSDGFIGLGNAALSPEPCKSVVDTYLAPAIIGESIWDYEHIWQKMYRQTLAWGRKGVGMTAISAVDIAIWDALGKSAKQPVFKLLGGKTKSKLPCYASKLYSQPLDSLAKEAKDYVDQGFKAMKLRLGWGPTDGAEGMHKNIELIKTVRSVVGDNVDLMADVYMGWTFEYAKRMMRLIDNENLRWLEEPVIADDIDGYADLKASCRTPISGGEHEYTLFGFRQLLEKKAIDVVQFDTIDGQHINFTVG